MEDQTFHPSNPHNLPGKPEMLEGGITINAVIATRPPDDHYLTHLPKHPGCEACNNCKVQRKARRDKEKAARKQLRREHGSIITISDDFPELRDLQKQPKAGAPTKFGDQVTSDNIIVVKQRESAAVDTIRYQ